VTELVCALAPAQAVAVIAGAVAVVATSGQRTRDLRAWLLSRADPLGCGDSDAPVVAQVLLGELHRLRVAVALPRCASCQRPKTRLTVLTPAGRTCFSCFQQATKCECVRCGRVRVVAGRQDDGRPFCESCRTRDPSTWRACGRCGTLGPITMIEASVAVGRCCYVAPALRCTVCGVAKAVRRLSGCRSVCRACRDVPVTDCPGCGLDIAAPGQEANPNDRPQPMMCARCMVREPLACTDCGTLTASRAKDGTARCTDCYHRPAGVCGRCGAHRPIARLATGEDPDLCAACWRGPISECAGCGLLRPCRGQRTGVMLCESCRPGQLLECSFCGRTTKVRAHWPDGPVCASCYGPARVLHGPCPGCLRVTRLLRHTRGAPTCPACLGIPEQGACTNCGSSDEPLYERGRCPRCVLRSRLRDLLPAPTVAGEVGFEGLRAALGSAAAPSAVLDWITRGEGKVLLGALACGELECTHEGLDALAQSTSVHHLRHLLTATGVLPDRDPVLAATDRWTRNLLANLTDPEQVSLLTLYTRWKLMPPLRAKSARAPLSDATGYAIRTRLYSIVLFLGYLTDRSSELGTCTQEDLDTWLSTGADHYTRPLHPFLVWATRRGAMPDLHHPPPPRSSTAQPLIGTAHSSALAQRLLHESGIESGDRVAAALVIIYGQELARIAHLKTTDITIHTDTNDQPAATVSILLGTTPITVPEPLAGHLRDLHAGHRGPSTANLPTSSWLFPSRTAKGRPLNPQNLSDRLARLGVDAAEARAAARFHLAAQIPAAVLADLLGISIGTAERWADLAGRDRGDYLRLPATDEDTPALH
jgi:hypothetical protein